ncbi:TetR/AcrR family transcriptional regulator [Ferrimonas sediminicola]|uniref:TetR/AcrR family transcriptional regulator n=1 Tax=Ferrimonas sediminicola TaxID=2569538 RepID=A0A4U1BJ42_9GAMM|nr:TetR/AcrR family transcriptional regulator [Ferrimonas sediminicola]TKB51175.1 TetR/AcrR family transcriptional regulator [Ferrimonas sediminicola]
MQCPHNANQLARSNSILDATERLMELQGVVSFKLSDVIKESGCANASFYKLFESKEDLIVCSFLRNATSNHFQDFLDENPELSCLDKVLLPIIFTFETLYFSPTFHVVRQVAVNRMVWSLASSEKGKLLEDRINLYWYWIHTFLSEAVKEGELNADKAELLELTQGITFYLSGSLNAFQCELVDNEYLKETRLTLFRHLQILFDRYSWATPLKLSQFERMGMKVHLFFRSMEQGNSCCQRCLAQQRVG